MILSAFRKKGFTLVEMLVTLTIVSILALAVLPLAKTALKREKEIEDYERDQYHDISDMN